MPRLSTVFAVPPQTVRIVFSIASLTYVCLGFSQTRLVSVSDTKVSIAHALDSSGPLPLVIRFSAYLVRVPQADASQPPVPSVDASAPSTAPVPVTFWIFNDAEGGAPLWTEQQDVIPNKAGLYTVFLGSNSGGLPRDIFASGEARWIETSAVGFRANSRSPLVSVPYALKASDAETLGGRPASDYVLAEQLMSLLKSAASFSTTPSLAPRLRRCTVLFECGADPPFTADKFESVAPNGPSFISQATTGPPFQIVSRDLVPNLNADLFHGFSDSDFAKLRAPNLFSGSQQFFGGAVLPATGLAPANSTTGMPSNTLDLVASAYNSGTNSAENELFRWQAQPVNSNSSTPSGRLSLLFGSKDAAPVDTGFGINPNGTLTFAPGQQLPSSAVIDVLTNAGVLGGSTDPPTNGPTPTVVNSQQYPWIQSPSSQTGIQIGFNSVVLKPCPPGVNGTDLWHYVYISGTGVPEAVLMIGGTCQGGAPTGTIEFTAANAHPPGYTISSATAGLQEAINDAILHAGLDTSRNVVIAPGNYFLNARLSIRGNAMQISGSGATIICAMQDTCVMLGDPLSSLAFGRIKVSDLYFRPGVAHGTSPAIEDNAQGSAITNVSTDNPPGTSFGYFIQVDDDQAATLDRIDTGASGFHCDGSFCSAAIYAPGPPGIRNALASITNSNLTLNCTANGVDWRSGNAINITNTVIQGFPEFAFRRGPGGFGNSTMTGVYRERGNCSSPTSAGADIILQGRDLTITGGQGSKSIPQFASIGSAAWTYYIVPVSAQFGDGTPLMLGTAILDGVTPVPLQWPNIKGAASYHVLRTLLGLLSSTVAPYGTGNYAVATNLPANAICDANKCSFTDPAVASLASYTVNPTYFPRIDSWSGGIVVSASFDTNNPSGLPTLHGVLQNIVDVAPPSVVNIFPAAGSIDVLGTGSSFMPFISPYGATLYQANGAGNPRVKGRINFGGPVPQSLPFDLITWFDSNYAKTAATEDNRPSFDPADLATGLDVDGNLYERSATTYRIYIGALPDGKSQILNVSEEAVRSAAPVVAPTVSLSAGPNWTSGHGIPTEACINGSLYSNLDGSTETTLFVCAAGIWHAANVQ